MSQNINTAYVKLYPKTGMLKTNVKERAMGRLLTAPVSLPQSFHVSRATKDLVSDVFFSLYKAEPDLTDNVPSSRYLNGALLHMLHNVPNFASLRSNTIADIATSMHTASTVTAALMSDDAIMAAMQMQDNLNEMAGGKEKSEKYLKSRRSEQQQRGDGKDKDKDEQEQQPQPQQQQQQQRGEDEIQDMYDKQIQKDIERTEKDIKSTEKKMDALESKMKDKVDAFAGNALSQGMASLSIEEGSDAADEMQAVMTTWGVEPGDVSYDDANQLANVAFSKQSQLTLIAEIGGRLAGVSASALQSVRDSYVGAPSEPTYTRDFLRMFPMERAYMSEFSPPFIRTLKVAQWAQRGVLGLRPKSEGKKRGALVIAVDGSSSMNEKLCVTEDGKGDRVELDRGATAKVIATGVARAMREDRFEQRRYTIFTFSVGRYAIKCTRSSDTWREMMKWIEYDPNGGTDFNSAFEFALDEMEQFELEGTLGADLLFITDGEAWVDDHIRERIIEYKDRTGARIFYIQVTGRGSGLYSRSVDKLEDINMHGLVDAHVVIRDTDQVDDVPEHLARQISATFAQVG